MAGLTQARSAGGAVTARSGADQRRSRRSAGGAATAEYVTVPRPGRRCSSSSKNGSSSAVAVATAITAGAD